jgi:hypothetical protein
MEAACAGDDDLLNPTLIKLEVDSLLYFKTVKVVKAQHGA